MFTLDRDLRELLSWPEFVAGLKRMQAIVVAKEKAGNHSPTKYRIDLTPPHKYRGDTFIDLIHNPRENRNI